MEFVCLAAGKGSRFGRLGSYLQKAMYPIGLRPFVEYSVGNLLASEGFDPERDRLTFVVGRHGEQVRAYFGDAYPADGSGAVRVGYVAQDRPLGTAHALHVAWQALAPDAPIVAWLGDLYVPAAAFAAVRAHPERNVLTLGPDPHRENPNVAVTTEGSRVTRAWQGAGSDVDVGLWKLAPPVLGAMLGREVDEFRALPSLQREIDAGRAEVGWVRVDEWLHLGGTAPTAEANVRNVARRVLELHPPHEAPGGAT